MSAPRAIDLGGVQKTLLLPLWGRAVESRKKRPRLVDPAAVRAVESIGYDFSTMARNISETTRATWIARALHGDRTIRKFLTGHPKATVVNLGCGLDTTFWRVDNGSVVWYDLDLPDAVELRRRFIGNGPRSKTIACSMLSEEWVAQVPDRGAFFLSMGVLCYFEEKQVRELFKMLATHFPEGEALFDVCSPACLRFAKKRVIEASGIDRSVRLCWGLAHARELEGWDAAMTIVEAYPLFRGFKSVAHPGLSASLWISDLLLLQSLVHVRLGSRTK
jgi:O-methyltransferase involved in polyketide biosynthesis